MADQPDREPPSFGEIRDALMPPGTDKDALWAALRNAQRAGGHVPGRAAPDISGDPGFLRKLVGGSSGPPPGARTPDYDGPSVSGIAAHEMLTDLLAAGCTEDQATSIVAKVIAEYGRDQR